MGSGNKNNIIKRIANIRKFVKINSSISTEEYILHRVLSKCHKESIWTPLNVYKLQIAIQ